MILIKDLDGVKSMVTFFKALTQALAAPLWGSLADDGRLRRKSILVGGTWAWGVITCALGVVSDFWVMFVLREIRPFL